MASLSLSLKYRPIRIGFLVRDGHVPDLVRAAEINTLLWGGQHNVVIPVGGKPAENEGLLKLFAVDVLYPVTRATQIDEVVAARPFLQPPQYHIREIFYQDWKTKKALVGYLDTLSLIDQAWEKDFKHAPKNTKSDCILPRWDENEDLNAVFTVSFGRFPKWIELRHDFEAAFLNALRSKEVALTRSDPVPSELSTGISPIRLTGASLLAYGGHWRENGIFAGSATSFEDLVTFWNLRATGIDLEFLPIDYPDRYRDFINSHVSRIAKSRAGLRPVDSVSIYYDTSTEFKRDAARALLPEGITASYCPCSSDTWNGLNIVPANYYFSWETSLGSSEQSYGKHLVSISLPEKRFIGEATRLDRRTQALAVSVDPHGEFAYPDHTLEPPFLPELNEFYSREVAFDPWMVRSEAEGISCLISSDTTSLSLHPIRQDVLIEKIFGLAGLRAERSQPGLIATRILEKLGGIEGGRILKIAGVRRLLQNLGPGDSIARGDASKTIFDEGRFTKYSGLYINGRSVAEINTNGIFDLLLERDFFRAGLELKCDSCRLFGWLGLRILDDSWTCEFCGAQNQTSLHLRNRGEWRFRKSGLFAKDNNQEGAIPVILTLLTFARVLDLGRFLYSTSLNVNDGKGNSEIDFCVVQGGRGSLPFGIAIGECKSDGGRISSVDVASAVNIRKRLEKVGVECFPCFAKTSGAWESDELALFSNVVKEGTPIILLTNRELEPYDPYAEREKEAPPMKRVMSLQDMADNSIACYFSKVSDGH